MFVCIVLLHQIKVRDIHVRYEDGVTNPDTLLAAGVTLHSLELKVGALNVIIVIRGGTET